MRSVHVREHDVLLITSRTKWQFREWNEFLYLTAQFLNTYKREMKDAYWEERKLNFQPRDARELITKSCRQLYSTAAPRGSLASVFLSERAGAPLIFAR